MRRPLPPCQVARGSSGRLGGGGPLSSTSGLTGELVQDFLLRRHRGDLRLKSTSHGADVVVGEKGRDLFRDPGWPDVAGDDLPARSSLFRCAGVGELVGTLREQQF